MHLLLATFLSLPLLSAAINTSPPCIKSCYDSNPGTPKYCRDQPTMTDEILARCTCVSLSEHPPLWTCLNACPSSELATYVSGENSFCFSDIFPQAVGVAGETTTTTTSGGAKTTTAGGNTGAAPASTTASGNEAGRVVPGVVAAGAVLLGLAL